jgi:ABC-type transport system substrate-binding protein
MRKHVAIRIIIATAVCLLTTFLLFQDKANHGIRVLIDRPPNTLDSGQNPDIMARKIIPLIEAGYRTELAPDLEDFVLTPPSTDRPTLRFRTVRDELARAILFEKGEADILFNSVSISKARWFREQGVQTIETPGHHLSFIGFNMRDPVLSDLSIRKAIFHALPLELWAHHKFLDQVVPLSAMKGAFQPETSRSLVRAHGSPLRLRFLTTPVREGNELALLVRAALADVGIEVEIVPLESSLFFQKLKRGDFQLFGSRLLRDNGEDSLADYFLPGKNKNYFSWNSEKLTSMNGRTLTWDVVEAVVLDELPLIPLFVWKHGLILSKRVRTEKNPPRINEDSFRFLSTLRIN